MQLRLFGDADGEATAQPRNRANRASVERPATRTVTVEIPTDRWVIDHSEYMGLVKTLVRARAVVRAMQPLGNGSVRVPPRAAADLRTTLEDFAAVDQARREPCRLISDD